MSLSLDLFIVIVLVSIGYRGVTCGGGGTPLCRLLRSLVSFSYFPAPQLSSQVLSVIHANFITSDATSHWLMGVALIAVRMDSVPQDLGCIS